MAQRGYVFAKSGSWFLRFRDDVLENGKLIRKQRCVLLAKQGGPYRKESDLRELVEEKLAGVATASKYPMSSESFVKYVEGVWLPYVKKSKKPSTYACYEAHWRRYIKPRVEKEQYSLRDFTLGIVSRLLADICGRYRLNTNTITKTRSILSAIFTHALQTGAYPGRSVSDNPAHCAMIPVTATEPRPTVAATWADVKAILEHLASEGMLLERAAVALVAFTGCRPGEARGMRLEEWNRTNDQIQIVRSVWHATEGSPKTSQSRRFVTVTPELRAILLDLWNARKSPITGYVLSREDGARVNLDNLAKRTLRPALDRCVICHLAEGAKHVGHVFKRDEKIPLWPSWYSLRRFHATEVRKEASSDTTSKALGNTAKVVDKHYVKSMEVLPDVRKAVNAAMSGLVS